MYLTIFVCSNSKADNSRLSKFVIINLYHMRTLFIFFTNIHKFHRDIFVDHFKLLETDNSNKYKFRALNLYHMQADLKKKRSQKFSGKKILNLVKV